MMITTAVATAMTYLRVIVVVHLLVGVDVEVVEVDRRGGHRVGQDEQEDEGVEPGHLEHPLEERRGETTRLVLVDGHHLPPVSVSAQHLAQGNGVRNIIIGTLLIHQNPT